MIELGQALFWSKTAHHRRGSNSHSFHYHMLLVCLDIAEAENLPARLLAYNRLSILSVWEQDYLRQREGDLQKRVAAVHREAGIHTAAQKTFLVTTPRLFGYVFNPVSFFISVDEQKKLHAIIAEVSNTFGEAHTYVMDAAMSLPQHGRYTFTFPKEFYVSPFLETAGNYHLSFSAAHGSLRVLIDLNQGDERIFRATLVGTAQPLTDRHVFLSLTRYPFSCALTMIRIQWQALILMFQKGVRVFEKPSALHEKTRVYTCSLIYRLREWVLAFWGRINTIF